MNSFPFALINLPELDPIINKNMQPYIYLTVLDNMSKFI